MKKLLASLVAMVLVISAVPFVLAAGDSFSIGGDIDVEEFEPMVFQCGGRVLYDDGMGWQHAFCPKLETVEKYETRGPFFTEWDMNLNLKKARQE